MTNPQHFIESLQMAITDAGGTPTESPLQRVVKALELTFSELVDHLQEGELERALGRIEKALLSKQAAPTVNLPPMQVTLTAPEVRNNVTLPEMRPNIVLPEMRPTIVVEAPASAPIAAQQQQWKSLTISVERDGTTGEAVNYHITRNY